MSALPPIADIPQSFDQLIRAIEQRRRDGEANQFRCFEVDYEFECGGLFDRNFTGLDTGEDLFDINREASKEFA